MNHDIGGVLAGLVAVVGIGYAWSILTHPMEVCPTCKGTREHRDALGGIRTCHRCHGTGRIGRK